MYSRCTHNALRSADHETLGRVEIVDIWTGERANALRAALRMTNEGFASIWARLCGQLPSGLPSRALCR